MKNIKILKLSIEEFAKIVQDLKNQGYTLEQIEKMIVLE